MLNYSIENFTEEEENRLRPYFTNTDKPVFALINLPEVVKGALFARYSRSAKSLRRLFLDEFVDNLEPDKNEISDPTVGLKRAEKLYATVFSEYGDDSVAQLGGVHLACEQVSNLLTKILERSRLMSYLEQSTRYIPYDMPLPSGKYRYYQDREILESEFASRYTQDMDSVFEIYHELLQKTIEYLTSKYYPGSEKTLPAAEMRAIRAYALDLLRGILPIGTVSNMGIYGSGQAYEQLLLRLKASDLPEARLYAEMIKEELMKVIPSFLTRVDRDDRGGVWVDYLQNSRHLTHKVAEELLGHHSDLGQKNIMPFIPATDILKVKLISHDRDGEEKVLRAILFATTDLGHEDLERVIPLMTEAEKAAVFSAYVGKRSNRRHKPGRAFENSVYNFEIVSDYGAFRDLQRHRLLTIEWQQPDPNLGIHIPEEIENSDLKDLYAKSVTLSTELYQLLREQFPLQAIYTLPMAVNLRYYMTINARELIHVAELRSMPQGHQNYRRIAQEMYRLTKEEAHHTYIAAAMEYVDFSEAVVGRLDAEQNFAKKQLGNDRSG